MKESVFKASYLSQIREDELAADGVWPEHVPAPPKDADVKQSNYKHLFLQGDASETGVMVRFSVRKRHSTHRQLLDETLGTRQVAERTGP